MPAIASTYRLPVAVRAALKQSIRESGYGDYERQSDWLKEQGYNISRSAVHRFGQRLKETDNATGADVEALMDGGDQLTALWERLGDLRAEEEEVLGQIRGLMQQHIGMSRDK